MLTHRDKGKIQESINFINDLYNRNLIDEQTYLLSYAVMSDLMECELRNLFKHNKGSFTKHYLNLKSIF